MDIYLIQLGKLFILHITLDRVLDTFVHILAHLRGRLSLIDKALHVNWVWLVRLTLYATVLNGNTRIFYSVQLKFEGTIFLWVQLTHKNIAQRINFTTKSS